MLEVILAMCAVGELKLNRPFLSANIASRFPVSLSFSVKNTVLQRYTPIKNIKRERENHVKGKGTPRAETSTTSDDDLLSPVLPCKHIQSRSAVDHAPLSFAKHFYNVGGNPGFPHTE